MYDHPLSPGVNLEDPPRLFRIGRARVPAGARNRYTLDRTWALHLYYGDSRFTVCGHEFELAPGSITVTPQGRTSEYRTQRELDHVFVHFTVQSNHASSAGLPLHLAPGGSAKRVAASIHQALILGRDEQSWAEAQLWIALHELAAAARIKSFVTGNGPDDSRSPDRDRHPALRSALDYIELNLPNRIVLQDLADDAGVSATHLNRLFAEHVHQSAMSYLRERRMDLARYLLSSTTIPVKEIAYQVGIPDVHAFNKLCKRYLGAAPTRVRALNPATSGED
jgi:AraC-like DNA-binding protein